MSGSVVERLNAALSQQRTGTANPRYDGILVSRHSARLLLAAVEAARGYVTTTTTLEAAKCAFERMEEALDALFATAPEDE